MELEVFFKFRMNKPPLSLSSLMDGMYNYNHMISIDRKDFSRHSSKYSCVFLIPVSQTFAQQSS